MGRKGCHRRVRTLDRDEESEAWFLAHHRFSTKELDVMYSPNGLDILNCGETEWWEDEWDWESDETPVDVVANFLENPVHWTVVEMLGYPGTSSVCQAELVLYECGRKSLRRTLLDGPMGRLIYTIETDTLTAEDVDEVLAVGWDLDWPYRVAPCCCSSQPAFIHALMHGSFKSAALLTRLGAKVPPDAILAVRNRWDGRLDTQNDATELVEVFTWLANAGGARGVELPLEIWDMVYVMYGHGGVNVSEWPIIQAMRECPAFDFRRMPKAGGLVVEILEKTRDAQMATIRWFNRRAFVAACVLGKK